MLISLSVENYKSFEKKAELSMISSSKIQEHKSHRFKIRQTTLLKNAVIYGANASGKSNLISAFAFIRTALSDGITVDVSNDFCKNRESNKNKESVFELQFSVGNSFYAYGFSAVLSQRKITEEWLYELQQNGGARQLMIRKSDQAPELGKEVKLSVSEKRRFQVYADDFAGQESSLFLSEMNHMKKYEENSGMIFFKNTFNWIMNNIIIISPQTGILNTEAYYNEASLTNISRLISTFDTGISEIRTRKVPPEEMSRMIPAEVVQSIFASLKTKMQTTGAKSINTTWRSSRIFFNIRIANNEEPEISTLTMKHGESAFDFSFSEESDGTKRLIDLIDMLLTDRPDTIFVVDELERSMHPKLTEHFLKMFMTAHDETGMQMLFTTHENLIMDRNIFRRDEIWFVERDADNASSIYPLDRFKERYDKKLSKAYLDGRYGAIPEFRHFSFRGE